MPLASLRPLRSRNFALIWSSALVSNIGSWVQTVALGTLTTLATHNAFWTALVMASAFLPMGLFAPLGGVLADRLDRRRWLIVTNLAEAAVAALLAVLAGLHADPPVVLLLVAFVGGAAGAIGFPSYQSLLPEIVDRQDLLAAVSLSSAQWNMGRVVGPAIAGIVLVTWSPAGAFAVNAVSFAAVVVALLMVRLPHRAAGGGGEGVMARLLEGVRVASAEPGCRSAILLISVVALIGSPFIGLVASVAIDGLHRRAGGPAVLTTAQGIGAVAGAMALAGLARRYGQHRVVIASLLLLPLALVAYGSAPSLGFAALGLVLVGACYIGVLSGLNTVVQLRAPDASRGRVLSLFMMALGTIYPLGLIVEGAIGQAIGIRHMTVLSGLLLLAVLLGLRLLRPGLWRALTPPAPPSAS